MSFAAHLTTMDQNVVNLLEGGETISYRSGAGVSVSVLGIFEASYEFLATGGEGAGVSSFQPALFVALSQLNSDPRLDKRAIVTVDGQEYKVASADGDGRGHAILRLHRLR
jgi:hypothetical protein